MWIIGTSISHLTLINWKWKSLSYVRPSAIPWTIVHQTPLSVEFSRQEYWFGLSFLSLGDLPNLGVKPRYPALQADSSPFEPLRKHFTSRMTSTNNRKITNNKKKNKKKQKKKEKKKIKILARIWRNWNPCELMIEM